MLLSISLPSEPDVRALFAHRFLLRTALIATNVFAWLFIFETALAVMWNFAAAIGATALLYGTSHMVAFLATPAAARAIRGGTRRLMALATVLLVAGLAALLVGFLSATSLSEGIVWQGIFGFVILSGLYRAFYFLPYRLNATHEPSRGGFVFELLLTLTPAIFGLMVWQWAIGPILILGFGIGLAILALAALSHVSESYENYPYRSEETFSHLFSRVYGPQFSAAVLHGLQGAGLLFVWPLAIFVMVGGSYYFFGALVSLTLLCILALHLVLEKRRLPRGHDVVTTTVLASSWALRFFAFSPILFIAADVLQHTGFGPRVMHLDIIAYEQAADGGYYLDEATVIKDMGLSLGRALLAFFVAALALAVSPVNVLAIAIFVAGAASLVVYLLERTPEHASRALQY